MWGQPRDQTPLLLVKPSGSAVARLESAEDGCGVATSLVGNVDSPPPEPAAFSAQVGSASMVAMGKLTGAELTWVGSGSEAPPQAATNSVIIAKADNSNL